MMDARRLAALALVLLPIGGCGTVGGLFGDGNSATRTGADETPEQRACRQEARTSPAMKQLDAQRMPTNDFNRDRIAREERVILARAYRDCLRTRGLTLPGGVAPEVPR
jgi:hypothetical protein